MTNSNQQEETVGNTIVSSTFMEDNVLFTTKSDHSAHRHANWMGDNLDESLHIKTNQNKPKKVTYSTIEVREYPIIPGDNPGSLSGVSLTIDWTPVETASCHVDEYEASKPPSRSMVELRMPPQYRTDLLRGLGFSRSEILASLKAANIVRNQRRRTAETMQLSKAQETLEKVKRATLNATFHRSKKSQEKKLLQNFAKQMRCFHKDELFKDDSGHNSITTDITSESMEEDDLINNRITELSSPIFRRKVFTPVR